MTKRCLDEAILQAYIDGELPQDEAARAAAHVAACDACAAALAGAEQETSFFAAAFAPDDAVGVPTEVLRSRIGAAVAQLEAGAETGRARGRAPRFGGLLASLSGLFSFTPQSAAAFAGVLALVAAGLIYFSVQRPRQAPNGPGGAQEIARVNPSPAPEAVKTPNADAPVSAPASPEKGGAAAAAPVKVNYTARRRAPRNGGLATRQPAAPAKAADETLPGEREYQTAIASLETTIRMGGDASLRPSLRVEYERNLALLDSAITQTRRVAAQNPKDRDAVGFLMAAYQSKVELLTKVADEAQFAALGR